jgi:hypothetical protein
VNRDLEALLALQAEDETLDALEERLGALGPRAAALDRERDAAAQALARTTAQAEADEKRRRDLEARIAELAQQEELDRLRPELDGFQVMAYLGIDPGPLVKEALDFLLELRMEEGILGEEEAYKRLDEWARERGIEPAGERVPKREKPRDPE